MTPPQTTSQTFPQRYNGPAKDGDWANYRETITALYLDQNKSLKDVMQIMREEYYFFATEKMYKIRFNKWGLHKKLRAHQVAELLVQRGRRAAAGKSSVSYVHGRKIDSDRLNTYLRRVSPARRKELMAILSGKVEVAGAQKRSIEEIICRTPSPEPEVVGQIPRRMEAPEDLRLPEECLQIVQSYVGGAFDGDLWKTGPNRELIMPRRERTWLDPVSSARQLFANGLTEQAFRMVRITFDDYRTVMKRQDPSLMVETCLALGALQQSGPGLAESLVNYAFNLSRIVLGPRHPLHLLFAKLRGASRSDMSRFTALALESFLHALQLQSRLKPTYLATVYRAMLNSDFIDARTATRYMEDMLQDMEAAPSPTSSSSSSSASASSSSPRTADTQAAPPPDAIQKDIELLKYHVSWILNLHNKPTEAKAAAQTLFATTGEGGGENRDPRLARFSCYNMMRTLPASSAVSTTEAIALIRRSLRISEAEFGRYDNATTTLLATLQTYLRLAGQLDEAQAVRREFESRWNTVVEGMSRLDCSDDDEGNAATTTPTANPGGGGKTQ
ncbi:hypothetical protein M426DRAFT_25020 [Hypoxylon sp. CI-4A]|nr:hypothetical protein M426DRAFT_25020 [Hypoxylon sp. CI-4A]